MRIGSVAIAISACVVVLAARAAQASLIAFDTAGDSAYNNGWASGSNGGYGWGGGWSISDGFGSAAVAADPNAGGEINSPFGLEGRSWEVSGDLDITRQFSSELQIGQTFSIQVDSAPGGEYGATLLLPDMAHFVTIADNGGSTYDLISCRGAIITPTMTNIPISNGPTQVTFTRADASNYTIGITPLSLGAITSTVSTNYAGGTPDGFWVGGEYAPLYFNDTSITPEPSAICLAGAAVIGLLRRRRPRAGRD